MKWTLIQMTKEMRRCLHSEPVVYGQGQIIPALTTRSSWSSLPSIHSHPPVGVMTGGNNLRNGPCRSQIASTSSRPQTFQNALPMNSRRHSPTSGTGFATNSQIPINSGFPAGVQLQPLSVASWSYYLGPYTDRASSDTFRVPAVGQHHSPLTTFPSSRCGFSRSTATKRTRDLSHRKPYWPVLWSRWLLLQGCAASVAGQHELILSQCQILRGYGSKLRMIKPCPRRLLW